MIEYSDRCLDALYNHIQVCTCTAWVNLGAVYIYIYIVSFRHTCTWHSPAAQIYGIEVPVNVVHVFLYLILVSIT